MDKATVEAMLPEIQRAWQSHIDEAKLLEGEFRRVQVILAQWPDPSEVTGEDKEVDAQAQPED